MWLAWRNLNHDRFRFLVTIVGIAFAVFLMIFQGSLLVGFLRAASKPIDMTEADLWIAARGVEAFEFASPLPERFYDIVAGVEGVETVHRMTVGFTFYQKPSGMQQSVLLVGAEPGIGSRFPVPYVDAMRTSLAPDAILVDSSNAPTLLLDLVPAGIEISGQRARVVNIIDGFGSFFGTPFVFTGYEDAVRYLRWPGDATVFLIVQVEPGSLQEAKRAVQAELPEVDVWTRDEFSRRARLFWVRKTGAGGAILMAAVLGFLVGLVIVSQNIYATTMENLEEFATLKAIGARRWYIQKVVLMQALACGSVGSVIGLAALLPLLGPIRGTISWIDTPWWLPTGMILVGLVMCVLASVASIRKALAVEPGRVFRA
ncbi:MAG: FtsX-like permease family protein [Luteitalea sp.]|nr:FtsX-like permease family protein [Luteitalea sp.]